jgi:hypothetical protein
MNIMPYVVCAMQTVLTVVAETVAKTTLASRAPHLPSQTAIPGREPSDGRSNAQHRRPLHAIVGRPAHRHHLDQRRIPRTLP